MSYRSLLYRNEPENPSRIDDAPDFFIDLNLDHIVEGIEKPWQEFNLRKWLFYPLQEKADIQYRQETFTDLHDPEIRKAIRDLATGIASIQRSIDSQVRLYDLQKEGWFLATSRNYCTLVRNLEACLSGKDLRSTSMKMFWEYLLEYMQSADFRTLEEDIRETEKSLAHVRYNLVIKSDRVTVMATGDSNEEDYAKTVLEVFSKFRETNYQPKEQDYRRFMGEGYVQAQILGMIEKLYPRDIGNLRKFSATHRNFIDETLLRLSREAPFYISYLEYIAPLEEKGLQFCIPEFLEDQGVYAEECFDLALSAKLSKEGGKPVTNSFRLDGNKRIIVVTGPNNGGKTTYARSIGQLFYLASLGLPVPARNAVLTVPDRIFTHFERSESLENLRGKLEDDLVRIRHIIESSTAKSVVVINEMLSSTTVRDASGIGKRIIGLIREKSCFCIFVTFLDEFTRLDSTVSMVAQVDPENPEIRTFRVLMEPSNGLAYARALARKHHVSEDEIRRRLADEKHT